MPSVEQYKEDIADKYIKDFKKDLWFFEKIMIAPISSKMKEILKSDKKIDVSNLKDIEDLWFWRKVLWVKIWDKELFEGLTSKTLSFIKEKQEKIIQAQTEWRLEELLNLVINWRLDNLEQRVDDNGTPSNNGDEWGDIWNGSGWNENEWNASEWNNWNWEWSNNGWEWNNENRNNEWSSESWVNPITAWVVSWVGWAAAYHEAISLAEKKLW